MPRRASTSPYDFRTPATATAVDISGRYVNVSGRYVKADSDCARDPRDVEARRPHRLRHQEGDRLVDSLLLDGELRADLSGAQAPEAGRPRSRRAGSAWEGQAHRLLAH